MTMAKPKGMKGGKNGNYFHPRPKPAAPPKSPVVKSKWERR